MARVAKPLGRAIIVRAVIGARRTQWPTVLEGRLPGIAAVHMLIGGGMLMSSVVVFDFGVIVTDTRRRS